MNRESQQHFASTPTIEIGRSKFNRSFTNKLTMNSADLVPIYVDTTILPGDTVNMNISEVVRMMTPITPVMDNANLDITFWFVPYRLIWEHFREFMGENRTEPWYQKVEYEIPQITPPTGGWTKGSLADYMGYPTNVDGFEASALPFRAYALIWNEWWRDQNLKNPCYVSTGDATATGVDILDANLDPVTDVELGACPMKAAKTHDYFTSCLPNAQKGPSVLIPLGQSAPIIGTNEVSTGATLDTDLVGKELFFAKAAQGSANHSTMVRVEDGQSQQQGASIGLAADLSAAVGSTVNQLRQAFAIQRFYERQALYGSRYIETVKAHFSVTNPDFRVQRPEYLGGTQIPININQVVQTDATSQQLGGKYVGEPGSETWEWSMSDLSPQGNTAAYSLTSGKGDLFTHSFTEHGILMGLATIRLASHTYQQGLNKQFMMKKFTDFYWPEFANLGNMPVYNKEIYTQSDSVVDATDGKPVNDHVFGYQEAWAHYRYFPDIVCGEMRSNYNQSLDIWHWADNYQALPSLGSDWIDEDTNMKRTLAVQDHDEFFGDFYFQAIYTRPMPLYSVPGLIDHH